MEAREVRQEMRELDAAKASSAAAAEPLRGPAIPEQLLPYLRQQAQLARRRLEPLRLGHHGPEIAAYETWITARLRRSGLEMLIPGGLDLLPVIYERMPEWQRAYERLRRPHSYQQLMQHLYDFLASYVELERPVPLSRSFQSSFTALASLLVLAPLTGLAVYGYLSASHTIRGLFFILLLGVYAIYRTIGLTKPRLSRDERQMFNLVNMVVLAEYLEPILTAIEDSPAATVIALPTALPAADLPVLGSADAAPRSAAGDAGAER